MMRWHDPLSLAGLVLVPALGIFLWWAERRRRAALARFVARDLVPAVVPDLDPRRRTARAVLLCLAVLLVVVALAGPQWGFRWQEVRRQGIDLVVAIDTSRSMLATDVKPNRLGRAKLAVQDLLGELRGDRVGLVAFAGTAFVQCPLTLDYGAFAESLQAIEVGLIPKGGTALAAALDAGLGAFEGREGSHQALVLITDGEDHEGDVESAVEHARARGVKVFTVGIGTTEGELIPGESGGYVKDRRGQVVKTRLDEAALQEIATETGGVYLRAAGPSFGLTELYRDYIGTMEKREVASTLERRFESRFQWPLAVAFFLLLGEGLIGERRPLPGAGRLARVRRWRARARLPAAAALVALTSLAWLDPHAEVRAGNRAFATGKYAAAATRYNEALVDHPDSPLLHFNLGAARYKQGQYRDALAAFEQVAGDEEGPPRRPRVDYNVGNVKFRIGETAATSDPQAALRHYAEALVAYRRAMAADPDDRDAKFNYEFVERKLAELKRKLEEERRKQQEQQNQPDEQGQPQAPGQSPEEPQAQQPEDQAGDEEGRQEPQQREQQGESARDQREPQAPPASEQGQPAPAAPEELATEDEDRATPGQAPTEQPHADTPAVGEGAPEAEAATGEAGEMSRREAAALLDSQRDQEVRPDEIVRKLQGGVVAEPVQDW